MPTMNTGMLIKLAICFLLPIGVLLMPIDAIPIDDLTLIQHRLLAIFLFGCSALGIGASSCICHLHFDHCARIGDDFR